MSPKRLTLDELCDDVVCTVRFADLINGDDVRMVESGGSFGFLYETPHPIGICGEFTWQQLKRYFAIESSVLGQVHFSHPARAEFFDNAVMRDDRTHAW